MNHTTYVKPVQNQHTEATTKNGDTNQYREDQNKGISSYKLQTAACGMDKRFFF